MPMKITVVAEGSASAARFRSPGSDPVTSWPVTNCTRRAVNRRVSGMPAAAAAAMAAAIAAAVARGTGHLVLPWPFALLRALSGLLPRRLLLAILSGINRRFSR